MRTTYLENNQHLVTLNEAQRSEESPGLEILHAVQNDKTLTGFSFIGCGNRSWEPL